MRYMIGSVILGLLLLSGCASQSVTLRLKPAFQLNQDRANASLPVLVKAYQLRDPHAFEQATFRALWQHDTVTLGDSLISQQHIMINPGVATALSLQRAKGARFLGVIAVFRKPQGNQWRSITVLPKKIPFMPVVVTLKLQDNRITTGTVTL